MKEYVCPVCGSTMNITDEETLVVECPCCGSIGSADFDGDEDSVDIWGRDTSSSDDMPEYCNICGGPYPNCKTSCKLFDD